MESTMSAQSSREGIVDLPSPYSVQETLNRVEAIVRGQGGTIFARIDQRAYAQKASLSLRPTQLLIFGDPHAGTSLMQNFPSVALDLPLKAVAWESEDGQVRLSYNAPSYLQRRHGLPASAFASMDLLFEKAVSAEALLDANSG